MTVWKFPASEVPADGSSRALAAGDRKVALYHAGGKLYAIDARCTHVGGPLDRGTVRGTTVTCPWHGSQFDITTGHVLHGPAASPVRAYKARLEGAELVLEGE